MQKSHTLFIRISFIFLLAICFSFSFSHKVFAEPPDELDYQETYARATVLAVISQKAQNFDNSRSYEEKLKVQFSEGMEKGKVVTIGYSMDATFGVKGKIKRGDTVIVNSKPVSSGQMFYAIYEPYRLNTLWWVLGIFAALILVVIGKKGVGAIVGLGISLMVLFYYVIPSIIKGQDALTTCILGAVVILFVTTYIAHGISLKTTIALVCTANSLVLAAILSILVVQAMFLLGLGDENSYALQLTTSHLINPQGVLLGGILIGTLGALNDVTTTQVVTIFTLARENPKQHLSHLFWKGMHIGREHIISMINTLVLAYVGSSFIVLLFFAYNPANLPWWLLLNNQTTIEEIIRAVVGSAALILAVPITTIIASYVALNRKTLHTKIPRFF